MGGSVQFHKESKRYFIQIYWKGKHRKHYVDCDTFQPFVKKARALKYLGIAQRQIDEGDYNPDFWKPDNLVSISAYAVEWLDNKDVTHRTWRDYKTDITKYIIPYFGDKDIRYLKAKDIKLFKKHLEDIKLSKKSVYNKMGTLKTMLRDAYRDEDIKRVPPFPVLSAGATGRPESLTVKQQDILINAIPERHRPVFEFGMALGLRVGEVRAIQKESIEENEVTIERAFSDNLLKGTKTELKRSYILTEYENGILERAVFNLSPFVFVREDGRPYTNKNLNKIWRDACNQTGIKIKLQNAMRHSLGCQLVDQGYDLDLVREQLGHTDIRTTKRYARRSEKTLTEAREGIRAKVIPIGVELGSKNNT
ncbi:MAG: tyrosine-type recombinase/integrase [Desulfobacterales bacterium]